MRLNVRRVKAGRAISGSADLTFGGYCRLLSRPEYWERLHLGVDRGQVVEHLETVRRIRNDVMHFRNDVMHFDPDVCLF